MIQEYQGLIRNIDDVAYLLGMQNLAIYTGFVTHETAYPIFRESLDSYLAQLGLWWSHKTNALAVSLPLLPGMQEHLDLFGVMPRVISPSPGLLRVPRKGDPLYELIETGFPMTQALETNTLMSMFVTKHMHEQKIPTTMSFEASKAGNSKIDMRMAAHEFGFTMPNGAIVYSTNECFEQAECLRFPLWLKCDGSGGDFCIRITDRDELEQGIRFLQERIMRGLLTLPRETLGEVLEQSVRTWSNRLRDNSPLHEGRSMRFTFPFIIEEDITALGERLGNVCCRIAITRNKIRYLGCSSQIIGETGEWWGSTSHIPPDLSFGTPGYKLMLRQLSHFGQWLQSIGFCGIAGPDGILYRDYSSGELHFSLFDPNGRPPISMTAALLHDALRQRQGSFLTINLTLPRPLNHVDELKEHFGNMLSPDGDSMGVTALLLAARSEADRYGVGMIKASPIVKMLFLGGDNFKYQDLIDGTLRSRGILRGS